MSERHSAPPALPGLTSARFFAAAIVLLCHFGLLRIIYVPQEVLTFLDRGRTAVSFFFVLSGFILTHNYKRMMSKADKKRFWVARFARVWPGTMVGLVLGSMSLFAVLGGMGDSSYRSEWFGLKDGPSIPAVIASGVSQVTLTVPWFPIASINQPWNSPSWSVGCEAFFYLLFPFLVTRFRRLSSRALLVVVVAGLSIQGFTIWMVLRFVSSNRSGFIISQFPVIHMFEFVAGICTALVYERFDHTWAARKSSYYFSLLSCLLVIGLLSLFHPISASFVVQTVPFCFLIFIVASAGVEQHSAILTSPLFLLLGEASFALYIIHEPIGHLFVIIFGPDLRYSGYVLILAVLLLSVVVYRYVELPARLLIVKLYGRRSFAARDQSNA